MKEGTRLYINLTNKCNVACPFCCMYSDPLKDRFMSFNTFKEIIDNEDNFELQLEGGEPLLHKDIFLFVEYAISTGKCKKILILTNGILLSDYLNRFIDIANWNKILFEFKVSINYYLNKVDKDHIKKLSMLRFATKYMPYINILFNVRLKDKSENIESELKKYDILDASNIYLLQSYGKLKDSKYDKPVIVQNINDWKLFASDGTCFGQDLIARSEYEGYKI